MPPRKKITTDVSTSENITKKAGEIKNQTSALETLRTQISKEINTVIDLLISQIAIFEQNKKQTQEEIETREKQKKQIEVEQIFNTSMEQKKNQAEFEEKLNKEKKDFEEKKEIELTELRLKKETLEEREIEYKELKVKVETFPSQLEKAIDEAKKQVTVELKKEHDGEKKFMNQKIEYDLKLLQQQINNLQQTVKIQDKEIISLKEEKALMMQQMKELAVAVIKGKEISSVPASE